MCCRVKQVASKGAWVPKDPCARTDPPLMYHETFPLASRVVDGRRDPGTGSAFALTALRSVTRGTVPLQSLSIAASRAFSRLGSLRGGVAGPHGWEGPCEAGRRWISMGSAAGELSRVGTPHNYMGVAYIR